MSLSWETLREMPRLRSYEEAKKWHDTRVPIRRRDNDNRPLGRRSHYFYIWEDEGKGFTVYEIVGKSKNADRAHIPSTQLSTYPVSNTHYHRTDYYTYEQISETHIRYPKGTIHIGYGTGPKEQRTPVASYMPNGVIRLHVAQIGWSYNVQTLHGSAAEMVGEVLGIRLQTRHAQTWVTCTYHDPISGEEKTGQLPLGRAPYKGRRYSPKDMLAIHKAGLGTSDFLPHQWSGQPHFINPVFPTTYTLDRKAMNTIMRPLRPLVTYIKGMQALQDRHAVVFDQELYEEFGLMEEADATPPLSHTSATLSGPVVKKLKGQLRRKKITHAELTCYAREACLLEGDEQASAMLKATMMATLYTPTPYATAGDTLVALREAIKYTHKEVWRAEQSRAGKVLKSPNKKYIISL